MPSPQPSLPSLDPPAPGFAGLVDARRINVKLAAPDLEGAIGEILALLAGDPRVNDLARLREDILRRERLSASGLEAGIALPHARTSAVSDFVLAIGRCSAAISGKGGGPVRLIFVLGSPPDRISEHLTLIAGLARALSRADLRERLLQAPDAAEFARAFGAPS